jgi:hypothetical protein
MTTEPEITERRRHRPKTGLIDLMAVVAAFALGFRWPWLIVPLGLLMVVAIAARRGAQGRRALMSLGQAVLAVYLPCLMGFLLHCDHCRSTWLSLLPSVPMVLPVWLVARMFDGRLPDETEFLIASFAALGLILVLAWIAARGTSWRIASLVLVLIASGVSTFGLWGAIQM